MRILVYTVPGGIERHTHSGQLSQIQITMVTNTKRIRSIYHKISALLGSIIAPVLFIVGFEQFLGAASVTHMQDDCYEYKLIIVTN